MEIKFYNIEEKDTDFAIIRSFLEHQNVRELFFKQIGKSGNPIKVYHSLIGKESDGHVGESDIVIICENSKERFAIFIEDKIVADPQPSQRARYNDRAESLKQIEKYNKAFVFLCAPNAYLSTEKAKGYNLTVSHEQIAELLDNESFDKAIFTFSIEEKKQGYSPIKDDDVTYFWERLYDFIEQYYPDIKLPRSNAPRGSNANWPAIKTNVKGLVIRWKTDRNYIDLEFAKMAEMDNRRNVLISLLNKYDVGDYFLEKTGKSLSLRKNLTIEESVSFKKPFDGQLFQINKCMEHIMDFVKLANEICLDGIKEFPIDW